MSRAQQAVDAFNADLTKTHKDHPDSREHVYARLPILATDCDYEVVAFSGVSGRMVEKPVAVTLEADGKVEVIERFDTIAEAEDFLATSAGIDPDHLDAGHYGVDAPETMVNP